MAKDNARPVDLRRIVTYDLTPAERARVAARVAAEGRSVSRWVADAIRQRLERDERTDGSGGQS